MAPSQHLSERDTGSPSPSVKLGSATLPVIALVGVCVSIFAVVVILIWMVVRLYRKRQRRKREDNRDSAFLTVKGVFKDSALGMKQTGFSRNNMTASVVLPDKAIIRPDATPAEVRDYYAEQGKLPRPFAPFSFALNAPRASFDSHKKRASSILDKRVSTQSFSASAARMPRLSRDGRKGGFAAGTPSPQRSFFTAESGGGGVSVGRIGISDGDDARDSIRDSFFGSAAGASLSNFSPLGDGPLRPPSAFTLAAYSRISVVSSFSQLSVGTGIGGISGMHQRAIRQTFTPILPDEPTVSVGERVVLLRSFDDGWCIIARPLVSSTLTAVTVATAGSAAMQDAELGAVPAWCFVKPLKGLRSERPVRSSSLGVTVQLDAGLGPSSAPVMGQRDDVMSWSNF